MGYHAFENRDGDMYDLWVEEDWSDYDRRNSFWKFVAVVVAAGLLLGFPLLLSVGVK